MRIRFFVFLPLLCAATFFFACSVLANDPTGRSAGVELAKAPLQSAG